MTLETLFIIFAVAFATGLGSALAMKLVKKPDSNPVFHRKTYERRVRRYSDGRVEGYERLTEQHAYKQADGSYITFDEEPQERLLVSFPEIPKLEE